VSAGNGELNHFFSHCHCEYAFFPRNQENVVKPRAMEKLILTNTLIIKWQMDAREKIKKKTSSQYTYILKDVTHKKKMFLALCNNKMYVIGGCETDIELLVKFTINNGSIGICKED
jgi:hypothetical protein